MISFTAALWVDRFEQGEVQDLLRLLHFALLDSSRALAHLLLRKVRLCSVYTLLSS